MAFMDYFGALYVINLPKRIDRKRECDVELQRIGLDWLPGKVELFPAVRPKDAGGFVNLGYHGCFCSHLEVWKRARERGLTSVFVCEDDVAFSPFMAGRIQAAVDQLSQRPWHLAYFGHHQESFVDREVQWKSAPETVMCTHCYALHESAYDRMIAFFEAVLSRPGGHPDGGPMSPDAALNFYRARHPDLITLIASPSLATQRSSRSDLAPRWFDGLPVLRTLASLARRLKR